jgi:hypothetical protein
MSRGVETSDDDRPLDRPQLPAASSPEGEVICVRDVDREVEVAPVECAAELSCGGVRDPPVRVELVSESCAGVRDQAV